MRRSQTGFTLIELMIAVAIVGVLCAIALPSFAEYMSQSKSAEAKLAVDKVMKNIKVYVNHKSVLPPSAKLMPPVAACASGSDKAPAVDKSVWFSDPGWNAIQFHLDEASYFQYEWSQSNPTFGTLTATSDLDCDGVPGQTIATATVTQGFAIEQDILEIVE